jgi:ribosome-associated protein
MAKTDTPRARKSARLPGDVLAAIEAARGKKADDVTLLDLRKAGAFTDFFVICTGQNPRQVQAIADGVEMALAARGTRPAHVEGYERGEWVLLDYFDVIVHVFSGNARMFYGLERLWGAAERVELPEEARPGARPAPADAVDAAATAPAAPKRRTRKATAS